MRKFLSIVTLLFLIISLFPIGVIGYNHRCFEESNFISEDNQFYLTLRDQNDNELDRISLDFEAPTGPCGYTPARIWTSSVIYENNLIFKYREPSISGWVISPEIVISNYYQITDHTLNPVKYESNPMHENMSLLEDHSGYRIYYDGAQIGLQTLNGNFTTIDYLEYNDQILRITPRSGVVSQDGRYLYLLTTMVYRNFMSNGSVRFDEATELLRTDLTTSSTVSLNLTRGEGLNPIEDIYNEFGVTLDFELVSPYSNTSIYIVEEIETANQDVASIIYKIDINTNSTIMTKQIPVSVSQIYDLEDRDILVSTQRDWYRMDMNFQKVRSDPIVTMDSNYMLYVVHEVNENPTLLSIVLISIPTMIIIGLLVRSIISRRKYKETMKKLSSRK